MTFKYQNVYINETSTAVGPYEKKGPLGSYFDKSYDDLYFGEKTWEQAERKLIEWAHSVPIMSKWRFTPFAVEQRAGHSDRLRCSS